VPHVLGVPRYLYRKTLASAWRAAVSYGRGDALEGFDHELWLWFFFGILSHRSRHPGRPGARRAVASAEVS